MKTIFLKFLKTGKGFVWGGLLLCLVSGLAFAGETHSLPPGLPRLSPPIPGMGDRYLGRSGVLRVDGKDTPVILCKSGYDSVLLFPGRKIRRLFLGGYSWQGTISNTAGESLVILDPPFSPPVDSNLIVVFEHGISIFRVKIVDPDKPFMARTIVRVGDRQRISVRNKKAGRVPEGK